MSTTGAIGSSAFARGGVEAKTATVAAAAARRVRSICGCGDDAAAVSERRDSAHIDVGRGRGVDGADEKARAVILVGATSSRPRKALPGGRAPPQATCFARCCSSRSPSLPRRSTLRRCGQRLRPWRLLRRRFRCVGLLCHVLRKSAGGLRMPACAAGLTRAAWPLSRLHTSHTLFLTPSRLVALHR